jgi:hypothetical protein
MKIHRIFPALSRSAILLALGLGLSCATMGCSHSAPSLTLTSIEHNQSYQQGFTNAYTGKNANGDIDVVLIDDATDQTMKGTAVTSPVWQVMHIRILWSPTRDMKAVVSNAAVKWYVVKCSKSCDLLEYSGIAFISLKEDDDSTTLRVQNTLLKPTGNHGTLTDPVGACRLEGTFVAHQDAGAVEKILSHVKTAVAAGSAKTPSLTSSAQ